jgi:ABC-type nickel/cobalt efflux system permease component RcnA
MIADETTLALTAASIGIMHTVLGPDHYVPFAAMAAARGWSSRRTLWVTGLGAVGHVLGSVALGAIALGVGVAIEPVAGTEAWRGDVAAWLLLGFGLAYFVWGVRRALRSRTHVHEHVHADGTRHRHTHDHRASHTHVHAGATGRSFTPWALFVIFLLGPCEPLIPLVMYPAVHHGWRVTVVVTLAFSIATIVTMVGAVWMTQRGLSLLPHPRGERFAHAAAGAAISMCAVGILAFGL